MSHENTITVEMDGILYVIPSVVNGQQLDRDGAVDAFRRGITQPFGQFKDMVEAEEFAKNRSKSFNLHSPWEPVDGQQ